MTYSEERRAVSGFERFLFAVTRVFALCGAVAVVIGIIVLAMMLFAPSEGTAVSYAEVAKEMSGSEKPAGPDSDTETSPVSSAQFVIPDDLRPYFGGNNERILREWINDLSEAQRKDFMKNMSQIAREAKAKKVNTADAINTYKTLKLKKLGASEMANYAAMATKAGYVAGMLSLLLTLSILSLVLVMLAIERNTRPVPATTRPSSTALTTATAPAVERNTTQPPPEA